MVNCALFQSACRNHTLQLRLVVAHVPPADAKRFQDVLKSALWRDNVLRLKAQAQVRFVPHQQSVGRGNLSLACLGRPGGSPWT